MTEAKKPTPRRRTPKKEAETKVESVKEETKIAEPKKEAAPKKLTKDDDIPVMNNTTGRYGYIGRSGYSFELGEYGDIADIPFGELQTMRTSQKRHLEDAFIIIMDERAVKELNYTKLYENVLDAEAVENVLEDIEKLEKILPKMPMAMRETFVSIAKRKFKEDDINLKAVRAIEKHLDVKFGI